MANIVLLDRNDNPVTHQGAEAVNLLTDDGQTVYCHDLTQIKVYLMKQSGSDGMYECVGGNLYGSLFCISGKYGCMPIMTEKWLQDYGSPYGDNGNALLVAFTNKELVEGETYHYNYIVNVER